MAGNRVPRILLVEVSDDKFVIANLWECRGGPKLLFDV